MLFGKGRIGGTRNERMHQEESQQTTNPDPHGHPGKKVPAGIDGSPLSQPYQFGASPDRSGTTEDLQDELAGEREYGHQDQGTLQEGAEHHSIIIVVISLVMGWMMLVIIVIFVVETASVLRAVFTTLVARDSLVQAVPVVDVAASFSSEQELQGDGVWGDVVLVLGIQQESGHSGGSIVGIVIVGCFGQWRSYVLRCYFLEPQCSELVGLAVVEILGRGRPKHQAEAVEVDLVQVVHAQATAAAVIGSFRGNRRGVLRHDSTDEC